jgi:hypothetical protein
MSNPIAEAFATATLSQRETTYFAALGRMIAAYAGAEASVHMLARHLSGLPEVKARAVFGGMRLSDLVERIRNMMRIDKIPDGTIQDVDASIVQLETIASQRGKLVHRMIIDRAGEEGMSVTNLLTAKSLAAAERNTFSVSDLEHMTIDCGAIYIRLTTIIARGIPEHEDPEINRVVHASWRYKPSLRRTTPKRPAESGAAKGRQAKVL